MGISLDKVGTFAKEQKNGLLVGAVAAGIVAAILIDKQKKKQQAEVGTMSQQAYLQGRSDAGSTFQTALQQQKVQLAMADMQRQNQMLQEQLAACGNGGFPGNNLNCSPSMSNFLSQPLIPQSVLAMAQLGGFQNQMVNSFGGTQSMVNTLSNPMNPMLPGMSMMQSSPGGMNQQFMGV